MTYAIGKLEAALNISHLILITSSQRVREPIKKKVWKIPYLGGGSGPGHFPYFQKLKKKIISCV